MKSSTSPFENVSHASAKKRAGGLVALAFGAALLLWSGCSTAPVAQTVGFSETDCKFAEATGTAVIQGHAFVRSDTGVKHGAAGLQI